MQNEIVAQARKEIADEQFRAKVEKAKRNILANRSQPWWIRFIPFVIRIERKKK